MTNEEYSQAREAVRQAERDRVAQERALSSAERAAINNSRNIERRQERESAQKILESGSINIQEIAKQGGSLGKKLEREIRRFEQTGRVSSWLAGETIRAETAQNAAQQSAFRQAVVEVIQSNPSSSFDISPAHPSFQLITRKPEIPEETAGAAATCIGLALYIKDGSVWIGAGTIAFELPSGFDPSEGRLIANNGSGYVWAEVEISQQTGEVISRDIGSGGSEPSSTKNKYYYTLGYYEYEEGSPNVINYGCGSIDVAVCRNWFAIQPNDYYRVFMARSS
jgi:hypothetical protein